MTTHSVAKHTAIQFASRAVSTVLGVIAIGIMTRALGREGFGLYTSANAFVQIFGVLTDFGIAIVTVQLLAEVGANQAKILGNALALRLASAAVFLGLAPIVAHFFPYPSAVKVAVLIFAVSQLANTGLQVATTIFQNRLRMELAALGELLSRVIQLAGVIWVARAGAGLLWFAVAIAAGNIAQFALTAGLAGRLARYQLEFDRAVWSRILQRSWPIGISIAFNVVYLRADTFILSLTRPIAEVGLYGAAYRVIDVLTVFPFLFMGLVLPIMANAWSAKDEPRLHRATQRAFDFLSLLALPLVFGAFAVGGPVMAAIAGMPFRDSGELLAVLCIGLASIYIGTVAGHGIVATGLQRVMVKWYAIDAIVSLVLYVFFIPQYGAWAGAAVTVFSEIFIAVASAVVYYRFIQYRPHFGVAFKGLLAAVVMSLAIAPLAGYPAAASVIVGATLYALLLWILRAVPRDPVLQHRA